MGGELSACTSGGTPGSHAAAGAGCATGMRPPNASCGAAAPSARHRQPILIQHWGDTHTAQLFGNRTEVAGGLWGGGLGQPPLRLSVLPQVWGMLLPVVGERR